MTLEIQTPGGIVSYDVPVICEANYTIDELFEKKLYFLIPFYFFNLEDKFDVYESDPDALNEFAEIYCGIIDRIGMVDEAELSLRSKGVIIKQMERVSKRLAEKRKCVREKVGEIMEIKPERWEWLDRFDAAVEGGREISRRAYNLIMGLIILWGVGLDTFICYFYGDKLMQAFRGSWSVLLIYLGLTIGGLVIVHFSKNSIISFIQNHIISPP